jgi:hypothetical protein
MSEQIESKRRPPTAQRLSKDLRRLQVEIDLIEPKAAAAAERCRSAAVRRIQAEVDALSQQVDATAASAAKTAKEAHRVRAARRYHERKAEAAVSPEMDLPPAAVSVSSRPLLLMNGQAWCGRKSATRSER